MDWGILWEWQFGIESLAQLGIAALCGAVIGLEREFKQKPAGLRTIMLICMGSALFMILSRHVAETVVLGGNAVQRIADPGRIASNIVVGIGFLGAGTIIQARGTIVGLTTAATIWVVAGIGMLVGAGAYALALSGTALIVIFLAFLRQMEKTVIGPCRFGTCRLTYRENGGKTGVLIRELLYDYRLEEVDRKIERLDDETLRMELEYCKRHKHHRTLLKEFAQMGEIRNIELE